MRLTHLLVIMGVMAKTAHGQIVDGGIIEGAIDWVLGTHFTFYGHMNATGDPVGPDDLVAYPWAHPHDRIGRQFNGLISVAIHQRAELSGNHKYCVLTFTRDWCNGEPTTRTELDVSYDHRPFINLDDKGKINSAQVIAGACSTVIAPWYKDGIRDTE